MQTIPSVHADRESVLTTDLGDDLGLECLQTMRFGHK